MAINLIAFSTFILIFSTNIRFSDQKCNIPAGYFGEWYSQEGGADIITKVEATKWSVTSTPQEELECIQIVKHKQEGLIDGGMNSSMVNSTMLMGGIGDPVGNRCYYCLDVLYRTLNIIQYKRYNCVKNNTGDLFVEKSCKGVTKGLPTMDTAVTMFRRTVTKMNCLTTIEGIYRFSYEVGGSQSLGGICDNPKNRIEACQNPGATSVDNTLFSMNYAKCKDVSTSTDQDILYKCMGSWYAVKNGVGYTFAAVAENVQADEREKFKCLMTLRDQKNPDNQIRWVMSRFPSCTTHNSIYDGDLKLVLTRVLPKTNQLLPKCVLPRNMSGTWFTQGQQFKSDVFINETHISFKTKINQFELLETYYTCQQTQGTRYMMTKVTAGRCEVDYVCFDIMPRHHSVVRYRIGKPVRLTSNDITTGDFVMKFREACSWMSFTFNRDDINWKYEVLILNPPSPVPCPIAGRYNFEQKAVRENEKYATRIRGVTQRPRIQVDCRIVVSEMKSCANEMNKISIDAEYCETVDYRGRPIGEYDVSDHDLTCVGFWMEDYRSYLITWDEEDAISNFRCWVYERLSWTDVVMSRAQNSRCTRDQKAYSYLEPGTGLSLVLTENERLFDDCPQRFDPGLDPYKKPTIIYILNKCTVVSPSVIVMSVILFLLTLFH